MSRPTRDQYFLRMAAVVASRATCLRRSVGCVLTNARGHVLATGYNGVAAGQPHCNEEKVVRIVHPDTPSWLLEALRSDTGVFSDEYLRVNRVEVDRSYPHACDGAGLPSGEGHDRCGAIHAEQNALLQCRDVWEVETAYVTSSPCVACTKLLLATSCRRIVYFEPHHASLAAAEKLWTATGREIVGVLL